MEGRFDLVNEPVNAPETGWEGPAPRQSSSWLPLRRRFPDEKIFTWDCTQALVEFYHGIE